MTILYFFNFGGAFVSPKTVKNNIAEMIIILESVIGDTTIVEDFFSAIIKIYQNISQ